MLCAVAVGYLVFSPLLPRTQYTSPLGFLAILPLVWAALRRGPRDTATVALILTGFAVWATIQHAGPFGQYPDQRILRAAADLHDQRFGAEPGAERRRGDAPATEDNLLQTKTDLDSRVRERTAALADANIHMQEAQRLANLGSWSWDIVNNKISWSEQLFDIYGVSPNRFRGTIEEFLSFIHPDDRAHVQDSITSALNTGNDFVHEERIFRPDGGIRYLQSVGEVIRDESGDAMRMLGVCLDVTERKQAESALRDSEQSYRLLLRGVRDYAIYMLDAEGRVRTWNESARRIKGYDAEEIVGRHFRIFLPEDLRAGDIA